MKNLIKGFAKINVLGCEPKLENGTTRQAMDRDGNPIWEIHVQEEELNEKFNIMQKVINKYKSLEDLSEGEHIAEIRQVNMGEGSGSFISVKNFFTVLRSVEKTATLEGVFSLQGVIPPSKRAKMEGKTAATQVKQ
jgi:hypothetical protein